MDLLYQLQSFLFENIDHCNKLHRNRSKHMETTIDNQKCTLYYVFSADFIRLAVRTSGRPDFRIDPLRTWSGPDNPEIRKSGVRTAANSALYSLEIKYSYS